MKSIKFGNKKALQIVSNEIKHDIKDKIKSICNMEIDTKYYNFLNEKNVHTLNSNDYKVCVNTFGHKYFLFMTIYDNKKYSIFINKKKEDMIYIRFRFDDDIFNNTLFDGELIKNNEGNWVYVITDILSYNNEFVLNSKTLEQRLELINEIYENKYAKDEIMNYCKIDIKEYFDLKYLQDIKERYIDSVPYKCSGLYFQHTSEYKRGFMYILPEFRSNDTNNGASNGVSNGVSSSASSSANNSTNNSASSSANNGGNNKKQITQRSANIGKNNIQKSVSSSIVKIEPNNATTDNSSTIMSGVIDKKKLYNFKIEMTDLPDIYKLYSDKNSVLTFNDYAGVSNMETSKLLLDAFEKSDNVIVLCEYSEKFNKWVPLKITNDKVGYSI